MPAPVNAGRIERLEIENFKSYKGHQIIGPFKNFTAIIGPNGAGKSNLMDAISFVLGVRSMQLRGAQLKDLLYAYDDKDREQRGRKAFVKLVFVTGNGEEMEFARTITSAGSSEYRIDNKTVTWDVYNNTMRSLGILVKARNFLVFQVTYPPLFPSCEASILLGAILADFFRASLSWRGFSCIGFGHVPEVDASFFGLGLCWSAT
jgi:structural maintenance of chromosome 1